VLSPSVVVAKLLYIYFICLMGLLVGNRSSTSRSVPPPWSAFWTVYLSQQTADEITDSADDTLFDCVLRNNDHVLRELLSKRVDITYNLRTRCHHRTIPEKKGNLADKNFITRMLYKNAY